MVGEGAVDRALLGAFEGTELPAWMEERLAMGGTPGVTLFHSPNIGTKDQVAALTASLQRAAGGDLPLLIATDQEGGQLIGAGADTTPFPGAMALGATGDPGLTERVGRAMGIELRALGITVDYAPVCDLATNPVNPSLGIRSFGDDPAMVGRHAAAMVSGLQSGGVVAVAKHFPGKGEAVVDPHHELPRLGHDLARLKAVELVPFRAAIEAGAGMVMVGHYALPAVTGSDDLPSSLCPEVIEGIIRGRLRFDGVVITDALNMHALEQGSGMVIDVVAALRAGVDLLLCTEDRQQQERLRRGLDLAVRRRLIDPSQLDLAANRVTNLRKWLAGFSSPPLAVVGCNEHLALAAEVARRSITLLRDETSLLPLRPGADDRLAAIMPAPVDLTPADTSSTVAPGLAAALRARHGAVDEFVTSHPPTSAEVDGLVARASQYAVLVVGTLSASLDPAQAEMVRRLLATEVPVVTVALRTPWDLDAYPGAQTYVCTYSILPPSMEALAAALFGETGFEGRLPVRA